MFFKLCLIWEMFCTKSFLRLKIVKSLSLTKFLQRESFLKVMNSSTFYLVRFYGHKSLLVITKGIHSQTNRLSLLFFLNSLGNSFFWKCCTKFIFHKVCWPDVRSTNFFTPTGGLAINEWWPCLLFSWKDQAKANNCREPVSSNYCSVQCWLVTLDNFA